jgi:hypothetical protein
MLEFIGDIVGYLQQRRKLWLLPLIAVLVLLGGVLMLSQSALAPFIYTLF